MVYLFGLLVVLTSARRSKKPLALNIFFERRANHFAVFRYLAIRAFCNRWRRALEKIRWPGLYLRFCCAHISDPDVRFFTLEGAC